MDLRRLKYFVTVAEERHFGRAAERLYVAQPGLSQQIRVLEKDLGVQLFVRSTRRVDLTPAGARFYERITEVLRAVDAAVDEARRIHAGEEGRVRLGFIGSATYELMPSLARTLQADLPKLTIELKGEMLSPEIWDSLHDGRLDIGLARVHPELPGVSSRVLRSEPFVLAVGVDHRLAGAESARLEDVSEESFVSYPRGTSATAGVARNAFIVAGFTPRVRAEVAETSTLISFVAAGLGVALVPESVAHVQIPGVAYVPLDASPTMDLVVAWRNAAPSGIIEQILARLDALVSDS